LKFGIRHVARFWYYFRMGYSTYLNFLLGYVSTLVTVYYLALKSSPALLQIFPKFASFALPATIVGVPLTIFVGWVHLKRSPAFTSELDINVEANPYNYKLTPGVWKEALGPVFLELLVQVRQLSQSQNLLDETSKSRVQELERRLEVLNAGGHLGSPRIKMREPLGSTD
jgi:hypothetical protein